MILPTTVTIHTSMYVKPEIHTADIRKVITNHFFQNPLLQSGVVRKSRVMMGRDKTQRIRFRSLSGTANTLLCSAGTQVDKHVFLLCWWTHYVENTGKLCTEKKCIFTFRNLIEAMQAEGQVRVSRVVLEDPTVCSGATVDSQTGVIVPAHQRLSLRLLVGSFAQTGAARAHLSQHELTDAKVEAQNHDVDSIDQQQTGSVVPGNETCSLNTKDSFLNWGTAISDKFKVHLLS